MTVKQFETTLGIEAPWHVRYVSFDTAADKVTIFVDFTYGSQFPHPQFEGVYPVYDTTTRRYGHLDSCGHKCILEVQIPRVELPDGSVRMVEPLWSASCCRSSLSWDDLLSDDLSGLCPPDYRKAA